MKLRLPLMLASALLGAMSFCSLKSDANTLNVFILTGQSNALGAVKDFPLTQNQLQQYATGNVSFWFRNITNYNSTPPAYVESTAWGEVVPQNPLYNGNLCMGPEYGFAYMMSQKGWMSSGNDELAIIKSTQNGGSDQYWIRNGVAYKNILEAVKNSLAQVDRAAYTTINIAGLLYLQGESGSVAGRYGQFISDLQKDLAAAGYQGVTVTIDQHNVLGQPSQSSSSVLKDYADSHPNTSKWVITDDLKDHATDNGLHFSGAAQLTIGARYAYSMALLNGLNVGSVRGQENAALDTAQAWWGGTSVLSNLSSSVIEWDLSSSNTTHRISATAGKKLEVGGIRIADTYIDNTTTTIQGGHASGETNAAKGTTLSIGASGIAVGGLKTTNGNVFQYARNLVIASNVELRGNQDWVLSGGSMLTIRGDSADSSSAFSKTVLSGSGNVDLKRLGTGNDISTVKIEHADLAGAARTWTLHDLVELQLNKSAAWENNSFVIANNSSSSICDGRTGTGLTLGSVSVGTGSQLFLGGSSLSSFLTLTTGNISFGAGASLGMDVTGSGNDKLIYSGTAALSGNGLNFNFNYGHGINDSLKITVIENAGNLTNFTWNETVSAFYTSRLDMVNGDLVLSFIRSGGVAWPEYSPGADSLVINAATFDARAASGITAGTVSTRTNSLGTGITTDCYYYANMGAYTGDVYGVLDGVGYLWASGTGGGSAGGFNGNTLDGSVYVKVTGDMTGKTLKAMIGAVNATVTGDVYMEFDAANATTAYNTFGLGSITGAYNAQINGSLTILVKSGTHDSNVMAGNVNNAARSIDGGTELIIEGGAFKNVYAGGSAGTINKGTRLDISGGTFTENVYGGGTGGTINGGTSITISGGTFTNTKGIYGGGTAGTVNGGSLITLRNIDKDNSFAAFTGVISGGSTGGTFAGTRELVLDNFTVDELAANISNFDLLSLSNGSKTGLTVAKMRVASSIFVDEGTELGLVATTNTVFNDNSDAGRFQGGGNLVLKTLAVINKQIMAAPGAIGVYTGIRMEGSKSDLTIDVPFSALTADPYANAFQIGNFSGEGQVSGKNGANLADSLYRYLQVNQNTEEDQLYSGVFIDSGTSSNGINRSVGLIKAGVGTLILSGNSATRADLVVRGGGVQIGNGATTGSWAGAIKVEEQGTLSWNRSDNVSISPVLSVEGTMRQIGGGLLTLASVTGTKGMLEVQTGSSLQVNDISNFTGNIAIANNSKLAMGGSYTLGSPGSIANFNGGTLELLNASTLNLVNSDIYGVTLNLVQNATLNATGATSFSQGIKAVNGILTKSGTGELNFMSANDAVKDLVVTAGSVRFSNNMTITGSITNNGQVYVDNGLKINGNDTGTGVYRVSRGAFDLGGHTVAGKVEISGGSLVNAGGLGDKSVSVVNFSGGTIDMGGMNGSKLASVNMNKTSGTISNLTGNADLSGSSISLFMTAANMGTAGTGVILFQNGNTSSLTVGNMILALGSDAVGTIGGDNASYQFAITNASLTGDKSKVTISDYNGVMNWKVTSVGPNGFVTVEFTQAGAIEVTAGEDKSYKSQDLTKAPSVINNGTLNIDFSDVLPGNNKETVVNYLTGTTSNAVINTGTAADATVNLSNAAIQGSTGNTAYAGSIRGSANLMKSGTERLTIDGSVSGNSFTVKEGTLVLNGALNLAGDFIQQNGIVSINGKSTIGGSLSLLDGSMTIGADTSVNGVISVGAGKTMELGSGVKVSAASVAGAGTIDLDNSTLSLVKEQAGNVNLETLLTGSGTFSLTNCNLALMNPGGISSDISLEMKGGALNTNGHDVVLSSYQNLNWLNLGANGSVLMTAEKGNNLLSGTISGQGVIEVTGAGAQTIRSAGCADVDIYQKASGGNLILEAADSGSSFEYRHIEIGSAPITRNGADTSAISLMNNSTLVSLSVHANGRLRLGGEDHQRAVTLTFDQAGLAADFASGATVDITVDRAGVDAGMASGSWAYIKAENGSISLSGSSPMININLYGLGTLGDWSLLPSFDVNMIYAEDGLVLDGTPNSQWTADMVDVSYAGFANIIFDIETSVIDGKLVRTNFVSRGNNPFLPYAVTENQAEAASSLWKISADTTNFTGDILTFSNSMGNALRSDDAAGIQRGLSSYAGSGITSLHSAQKAGMKAQVLDIRNRVSGMGISPDYQYDDLPIYNAWISGNGGYSKLNNSGDASGYSLSSWGGTAGFDLNCSDSFTCGVAFSASYGDLTGYMSKGDMDSYYGSLFFKKQSGKWGHNLIVSYGANDASLNRTIADPDGNYYSTKGNTDGSSYGAFYEGTYDVYLNEEHTSMFQPIVNASLYKSTMKGFSETGGLGMRVDDMDSTYGAVALGGRLMGVIGSNILGREATGEVRLLVVQDMGSSRVKADLSPIAVPGAGFRVSGAKAGSTGVQVGGGVNMPVGYKGAIFADVDAEFRSGMNSVGGSVGYKMTF